MRMVVFIWNVAEGSMFQEIFFEAIDLVLYQR